MWGMRRLISCVPLALLACEREPRDPTDYPANAGFDARELPPAADEPIDGKFTVTGVRPDGKTYDGIAEVTSVSSGGPIRFTWTLNGNTFGGLGTRRGDTITVGWSDGTHYGVVDYAIASEGTLGGVWYDTTSANAGSEVLTGGLPNLAGVYTIKSGVAPDHSSYTGTCDIVVLGELHTLVWHVGKDTFRGLGIRSGAILSVGFTTVESENFGVVQYKLSAGNLVGRWAEWSQKVPTLGSETLTKK